MAERNKLSQIPSQRMPERPTNFLSRMADEAIGAFERYGRRSGAQRDASLAMLNQAADPNTDPLTGAGMKALGLAGLVTHPLAFFPTREEWDQRLEAAGNTGRMSRSIGGFLSDLPNLIDPQMAAGGAALAAAPLIGKMAGKVDDVADAGRVSGMSNSSNYMGKVSERLRGYLDDVNKYGEPTGAERELLAAKFETPEDIDALLGNGASRTASQAVAALGESLGFKVSPSGASDTSFYMTFKRPIGEPGKYGTPEEYFTVRVSDHPNTTRTRAEQPDINYAPGVLDFATLERMLRSARAKNRDAVINDLDAPEMEFPVE
jgi:hypothetical protein